MGWSTLYYFKKPTYPQLIRMFFANMRINMESMFVGSLQNKHIEFDCDTLTKILSIYNEGPRVFDVNSIPTIKGFTYDEVAVLHAGRYNFVFKAKIKSQVLLLRPRILHRIIAHNIFPKKGHFDEVTFMNLCLIDYIIRGCQINLSYIMMRNLIMAHDQKQKSLSYGQCLTTIFIHFEILLTIMDRILYSPFIKIDNKTLTKTKFVLN
jgi:hypothetical protein